MQIRRWLATVALGPVLAFTACEEDSPPNGGAAGGAADAGSGAEVSGAAGEATTATSSGGAALGTSGAPANLESSGAPGVGGAAGAAGGAEQTQAGGGAGGELEDYNKRVCTERFAFADQARAQVAPLVGNFNACTTAADCAPLEGYQLGCSDSNWFWLGMYTIRADSRQAFRDAIAEVAATICDDPPEPIVGCTMGSISFPQPIVCEAGRCYQKL